MERARNQEELYALGDPERWGSEHGMAGVARVTNPVIDYGPQVLRVQARDLIATAWDFFATYTIEGLAVGAFGDSGSFGLELTIGTGQSSAIFGWSFVTPTTAAFPTPPTNPIAAANLLMANPASGIPGAGVALLSMPLPASTIAARPFIFLTSHQDDAHNVVFRVNAHCAPRAWPI